MAEIVLVVDDEPGIRETLSRILADEGYEPLTASGGREGLETFTARRPAVVLLDVWLPDLDGLEVLGAMREADPSVAVVMMSGHGDVQTAVRAIKLGAHDYLEKPPSYDRVVQVVQSALAERQNGPATPPATPDLVLDPLPPSRLLVESDVPQRTLARSTVLYGLGLHSGTRTGLALQPLPPDSGVHFLSLPRAIPIPARVEAAGRTEYATTLTRSGDSIKTVEHLLSALHARGITNLLAKVHGEVPVLDGSAVEFCRHFEEVGVVDQDAPRREIVIDRRYVVEDGDSVLSIEPAERLEVSYLLRYPSPVGEQSYELELADYDAYVREVAPARTFGFMKDLAMLAELGLGSGGRLDNCILIGDDGVINTELRFPDELVRHKVLDLIGDLFLFGHPVKGRVTARLTGHRHNIALVKQVLAS